MTEEREGPQISAGTAKLLKRHAEGQRIAEEVRSRIRELVDQLVREFPGHVDIIRFHLGGQSQRLLSEQCEERKRNVKPRRKP